jgi:hypothetical protein
MSVTSTPSIVHVASCGRVPLAWKVRLLAGLVAADVDAVDEHAWHAAHQRERIARSRDLLQLVRREVGRCPRCLAVDDGRLSRHRHGFLDGGDLHGDRRHFDVRADAHLDLLPDRGRESRQREREPVGAGRQIQEAELAGRIRRGGLGAVASGQRDGHAGKHGTLFVGDRAAHRTGAELLGERGRRSGERKHRGEKYASHLRNSFGRGSRLGSTERSR